MATVSVCALMRARPDAPLSAGWLERTFAAHWPAYGAHDARRAWSVGTVIGTETLVQARPSVTDPEVRFVQDLLRAPSQCTLGLFAGGSTEGARTGVELVRFQRWVCACDVALPAVAETPEVRTSIRAKIPDFLQRSMLGRGDTELFGMAALGALHRAGALGATYAPAETIRAALAELVPELPPRAVLQVFDGRTLAIVHRDGRLVALEPEEDPERAQRGRNAATTARRSALILTSDGERPDPAGEHLPDGVLTLLTGHPWQLGRT